MRSFLYFELENGTNLRVGELSPRKYIILANIPVVKLADCSVGELSSRLTDLSASYSSAKCLSRTVSRRTDRVPETELSLNRSGRKHMNGYSFENVE